MRRISVVTLILGSLLGGCTTTSDPSVSLLYEINTNVNRTVAYVPEPAGKNEWKVAVTEGDCEDIAIRKHRDLVQAGFPADKLSVLVVPGHALLLARTEAGSYVLDSSSDRISTWNGAGREYMPLDGKWLPREYVLVAKNNAPTMLASVR
jgi:predicted transglutaminase-like cysteine proteinase